ncbi:type I restriction-modification system, specificity subunit S [Nonlabens ulvanivorans]|nr:restriction endonuclease subunit S [Nonlabens ulvanivorans]GAK88947.1 type I restriction-modification system, specificity subunit S [Nonlabens ulvanivorans]
MKNATLQPRIPQLRFPAFDGEWRNKTINDLVKEEVIEKPLDGNHGNIHPVSTDFVDDGIPFIMANCFNNGQLNLNKAVCIRKKQADKLQKGFSIAGDVLLTHKGSVGLTAIVPKLSTDYIMLTPQVTYYRVVDNSYLINEFLYATFQTSAIQRRLKVLADGGTRPYVGITLQRTLQISLPEIPEQQKIATFLTAVDDKISQLTSKKEQLTKYKKGVMQQLFSQELRFQPDSSTTSLRGTKQSASNENQFPDWEEKRLGEVCNHISYGLTIRPKFVQNGIPLISAREITSGTVNFSMAPKISIDDFSELSDKAKPKKGDIFLTKTGTIGYTARFMEDFPIAITQNIAVIRLTDNKVNSALYLMHYFKTSEFYRNAISKVNQSTIMDLQLGDIRKLEIPFPSIKEQQKIASYLSALDDKIEAVQVQIEQTQEFKKGLLQQLFV